MVVRKLYASAIIIFDHEYFIYWRKCCRGAVRGKLECVVVENYDAKATADDVEITSANWLFFLAMRLPNIRTETCNNYST